VPIPEYQVPDRQTKYAESIPYESLYKVEKPNKNTMEYNTLKMDELIKEQNQKIIEQIFQQEFENGTL